MESVLDFLKRKTGPRITMITAYDYASARVAARSKVDLLLVGDSVAMVVHGHPNTLAADVDMMVLHTAAVARGAQGKLIVADLPFLSYRQGLPAAVEAAGRLIRAGAQAVKLEGIDGHEEIVRHLVESGIPVMGHVGLTPQHVLAFGGFRVQGRNEAAALRIEDQARRLAQAGCFGVVLEGMPSGLATRITQALTIPTIGIGAGAGTDGQVLVWHDLLGLHSDAQPRFVRRFGALGDAAVAALDDYVAAVGAGTFPTREESYG